MYQRSCGRCHECGSDLRTVMDGEEWCGFCKAYRRYRSHGWSATAADPHSEHCPEWDKIIVGRRDPRDGVVVEFGDRDLLPSGKHSYAFEWGYGGSGPAELAWCILEAIVGRSVAEACYQGFKWDVVANLPFGAWKMSADQVKAWTLRRYLTDNAHVIDMDAMAEVA